MQLQNIKESWQNIPDKTKKIIKAIVAATAAMVLIAVLVLFLGRDTSYGVLFTGLNQSEAQEIAGLLQDQEIDYKYNSNDGTIRVPTSVLEQTKGELLIQGYPKNGFTYDMYLDNTGLMTTESDKKQITLYEVQDRLGATIRAFEGVQDATVTIAEASEQRYVLQDETQESASASVLVTMRNGSTLTSDKAQAIKNLISHAVRGMTFSEVKVFDASTMLEVGGDADTAESSVTDLAGLTSQVENNIAANVRVVLEKLYGAGNVAVSVKGTLNMEKLISESTQYSTPEKIDENDKTGLLDEEDLVNENSLAGRQDTGGVVGADANEDTPRYTAEDGTENEVDSYSNGSATRHWLYNVLKEQRQIDPGVLEDTSVAVVVLTNDTQSVSQQELYRLVANAAGIPVDDANDKITVVRAPGGTAGEEPINKDTNGLDIITAFIPLPLLIALCAALLLIFLLILLLLLRRRRKRRAEGPQDEDFEGGDELSASELGLGEEDMTAGAEGLGIPGTQLDEDDEFANSEEIMNLRMQRSMRLKQNIGDFVEENPQIAAKLIQSWLRGEEGENGRSNSRKQSR